MAGRKKSNQKRRAKLAGAKAARRAALGKGGVPATVDVVRCAMPPDPHWQLPLQYVFLPPRRPSV